MTAGPEDHAIQLGASGISAETAKRADAIDTEGARRLGFVGNGLDAHNLTGLAFPYREPRTGATLLTRIRPDVTPNGRKYLAPVGSRNRLYLPCVLSQQLEDVRFDAIIVEGEKKTLAVLDAAGSKYLAIGVAGVWSWRTSDKEKRAQSAHPGTKTVRVNSRPIEDLDWITWKDRRVFIAFDSDGSRNPQVQNAEDALVKELRKRGARPLVVTLPPGPNGEKQGIDDLLARERADRRLRVLERLLASAAPRRKLAASPERALDLAYEPSAGFMRGFDEYVDPVTDAPAVYRPFAALFIAAAVVGPRVIIPFGFKRTPPNLYQLLLGPSGIRKTTMVDVAHDFIGTIHPDIVQPNEATPERMLKLLETSPHAVFLWREFAGFMTRASRDFMGGLKEILMELFDCPDAYRRELQSAQVTVTNPVPCIFGASVTSYLADALKQGDLRSGFLNRFGLVLAERKEKFYPIPSRPDQQLRQILLSQLRRLSDIRGDVDLSQIETRYTSWLRDHERQMFESEHRDMIGPFYTRLSIAALKYAALLELLGSGNLTIHPATLEEALVLVEYQKAVVAHLLRVEFAPSESEKKAQRVLRVIHDAPGSKRKQLLQRTRYTSAELTPVLTTLQDRGDVYEADGGYWPV